MPRVHWWLSSLTSILMVAQLAPIAEAKSVNSSIPEAKALGFDSTETSKSLNVAVDSQGSEVDPYLTQSPRSQVATIEAIDITVEGNRVLIRADRPLDQRSYWDRGTLAYQIEIRNARLSETFQRPDASDSEAISWIRTEQADSNTVMVRVMPAPQVSIGEINQPSPSLLSLELNGYQARGNLPAPNLGASLSGQGDLGNIPDGQIVIVLDPGHGGRDPGAVGIGGLSETDIVNPMSHRIRDLLEEQGVRVIMTREDNRTVDLQPRVELANRVNANLFVSLHANAISMSRPDVNGIETYYFQTGEQLARTLHRSLLDATGGPDRGVRTARFYVLRHTRMPAVLLELGFVTGSQDARRLADPEYREVLSQAIARGILQYVRQHCPGPQC
ncbi:N-acetylmuramoyl-L-alanine amidase [Geitlerinema sp. P-1104]|uniref:N-acetylmuramoyl-L-alanine amidase family protein n=1 Tax=Geitlerinema sp. P-1104 TaxID=2546230 RepID=UPI001476B884|nr:N-acetylmuramoyl-L-alanine amidase [Geitlerinema sp. P-1104]NMG58570.1 N-acetylmuramoyl-L-alanine amidase [Geitlerinema sp. P-1104]